MSSFSKHHPFMKDKMGRYRTTSLFWETRRSEERAENLPPLFTLKDHNHTVGGVEYLSLKKIYLSYDHIPGYEYEFAMDVLGSWDHWKKLADESTLKNDINLWRQELEIKLRTEAIKNIIKATRSPEAKALVAAKYMANKEYKGTGRGRPSKAEVERERKIEAGISATITEDMERLGLKVA